MRADYPPRQVRWALSLRAPDAPARRACGVVARWSARDAVARTLRAASRRKLAALPNPSRSCGDECTPALRRRHGVLLLCANGARCVDETRSRCGDAHAARRDSWKDALLTNISRLVRPPLRLTVLGLSCPNAPHGPTTPTTKSPPSANHGSTAVVIGSALHRAAHAPNFAALARLNTIAGGSLCCTSSYMCTSKSHLHSKSDTAISP